MALFFVNYDLIKQKDYQKLWDRLGQYGGKRVLLSTWAIKGDYTAAGLRDDLKRYVDNDDRLLVDQSFTWASWNALIDLNTL
jgi:hypothetical protein